MSAIWFSTPTLLMITLGFSGLLGDLIYRLRVQISGYLLALCTLVIGMVILPPLSLPVLLQRALWAAVVIVILLYAFRPGRLPQSLHSRRFAMRYVAVTMILSAISNALSGPGFPALLLAFSAWLAALLAWLES